MTRLIFGLTAVGGIGLLTMSVWPGLIEATLFNFVLACFSIPLLGSWFLLLLALAGRDFAGPTHPNGRRRWWGASSAAVTFATLGLLWQHVPQRIAFAFCHSDFRGLADAAPVAEGRTTVGINRGFGPYTVDEYGADQRGGVFFRTGTGPDGIGPDQISYGFAFRPNGGGTPFGNAHYHQHHLFGDWYAFGASNDW